MATPSSLRASTTQIGTLPDSDTDGVNADGSPQFPDEVIGTWTCTGYFIADGARTSEGATIVVSGFEGAVSGEAITGAITGGTGEHDDVQSEAAQTFLGMSNPELPTMGINKTVELRITD